MAVLEILTAPHPNLKTKAKPVEDVSTVQKLIDDMLDTLYATDDGIGLAANQVGVAKRVLIIDLSDDRDQPLIMINPVIEQGEAKEIGQEACLSVPGYAADVERFTKVNVSYMDRDGNQQVVESDDFLAIVMQHEIDHLEGKLFIDYLSPIKRKMAIKKVQKMAS